jgi:predicted DNA-binding ribbon-helix-helix protein
VIRNVVVAGRRTSVRLEPAMWEAIHDIARRQQVTIHDLVTEIDRERTASSLTAAIRVYIVDFYRAAALHGVQPEPARSRRVPV